jgi:hypothetical protein
VSTVKIQITDSAGNEQVINLSEDQVRGLEQSAARNNISFAEALQQAIAGGNFLEAVEAAGGKVLVEKDKQIRPVVKEPQVA